MENAQIKTIMNVVSRSISEHVLLYLERYRKLASIICWHWQSKVIVVWVWFFFSFSPIFPGFMGVLLWAHLFNKSQDKAPAK